MKFDMTYREKVFAAFYIMIYFITFAYLIAGILYG